MMLVHFLNVSNWNYGHIFKKLLLLILDWRLVLLLQKQLKIEKAKQAIEISGYIDL